MEALLFIQIDHMLIEACDRSDLIDVQSCRGANIDSNLHLILAHIHVRISIKKENGRKN